MSKIQHQRRTCKRHKPFAKHGHALAHLVDKLRANEIEAGSVVFYCNHGRHWHIASPLGGPSLERVIRDRGS